MRARSGAAKPEANVAWMGSWGTYGISWHTRLDVAVEATDWYSLNWQTRVMLHTGALLMVAATVWNCVALHPCAMLHCSDPRLLLKCVNGV